MERSTQRLPGLSRTPPGRAPELSLDDLPGQIDHRHSAAPAFAAEEQICLVLRQPSARLENTLGALHQLSFLKRLPKRIPFEGSSQKACRTQGHADGVGVEFATRG